jgi:hypothetical protein
MKTSEFRRGNIVEWNRKPFVISRIFDDSVENELWCKPIDEIHPIPLTKEILLKCGFEILPWGYVKKSSMDFGIRLNLKTFNYEVSGNNSVKIQYLHQLQNLYFALTNEELKI